MLHMRCDRRFTYYVLDLRLRVSRKGTERLVRETGPEVSEESQGEAIDQGTFTHCFKALSIVQTGARAYDLKNLSLQSDKFRTQFRGS